MNSIKFVLNQRNKSDALNYIIALSKKTDKKSKSLSEKINDGFYILSHFEKKTTKTPKREIDLAKVRLKRFLEEQSNEDKP